MTSYVFDRSFECAPHATRSVAMALTLSLNLAIVLFALLPSTPFPVHMPPPQSLLAAILQPPPPAVSPPAVPTLNVVKHVVAVDVPIAATHPLPITVPVLSAIAQVAPVHGAASDLGTTSLAAAGDSNASIAYETATPPAYPIQALRSGVQGTVLLKVLVDASGKPMQVLIEHSSGSHGLDDAARRHVLAAWRFHPAMRDGRAIKAWALVPVQFNLNRG